MCRRERRCCGPVRGSLPTARHRRPFRRGDKMKTAIACLGVLAFAATASPQPAPPAALAQGIPSLDAGSSLQFVPVHRVLGIAAAALTAEAFRDTRPGPEQYALPVETSITPFGGVGLVEERWDEDLGQMRATWRLRIASQGAVSMELGFHTYWMPPGESCSSTLPTTRRFSPSQKRTTPSMGSCGRRFCRAMR